MAARKKRGPKKKRPAKPRKAKRAPKKPRPAPSFTKGQYNYYTNWVIHVITGNLAAADELMRRHGSEIRGMAAYLRETLGLPELGTVYRGILLEPDKVPSNRMVEGHGPETGSSSWTSDPEVACWFADVNSQISGFVKQIRPRVRGWITETKPRKSEVLWHHSWEGRYPIPDLSHPQGVSLVLLAQHHPQLAQTRDQLAWALQTQQEVILTPFKRKVKLVPIEDFDCPDVQGLDRRLGLPGADPLPPGLAAMFGLNPPPRGDSRLRQLERKWRESKLWEDKAKWNEAMLRAGRIPEPDVEVKTTFAGHTEPRFGFDPHLGQEIGHVRVWHFTNGRGVSVAWRADDPLPGRAVYADRVPLDEHEAEAAMFRITSDEEWDSRKVYGKPRSGQTFSRGLSRIPSHTFMFQSLARFPRAEDSALMEVLNETAFDPRKYPWGDDDGFPNPPMDERRRRRARESRHDPAQRSRLWREQERAPYLTPESHRIATAIEGTFTPHGEILCLRCSGHEPTIRFVTDPTHTANATCDRCRAPVYLWDSGLARLQQLRDELARNHGEQFSVWQMGGMTSALGTHIGDYEVLVSTDYDQEGDWLFGVYDEDQQDLTYLHLGPMNVRQAAVEVAQALRQARIDYGG